MIKEKPILFNSEMVNAILDGKKTQTRRVIKNPEQWMIEDMGDGSFFFEDGNGDSQNVLDYCPYGKQGDRLWVRETWFNPDYADGKGITDFNYYKATDDPNEWKGSWKPSIHMPRWASRINLEVTGVRVERVRDISTHDAISEGILKEPHDSKPHIAYFADLWDSINKKRGYGWDINPWAWVVEFKKL